ncbi:MAG TPA: NTF2 fold immunity protein [Thermoanaerobaculia bacterium]|nr:NTF2 fold immunity protein [Thermoanaerobaculia bacterium]
MASGGGEGSSKTIRSSQESPEDFLRRFFRAMQEWEEYASRKTHEAMVSENEVDPELGDQASRESIEALRRIFREFCTTEEPERGLTYSEPPEYDPEGEKILEVRPSRGGVRIITQQTTTGYDHKLVYTLVKGPDGWRLKDNRVYIDEDDGSEQPWDL